MQEGVVLGTMVVPHAKGVLGIVCPPALGDNRQQSCDGNIWHGYGSRVMTKGTLFTLRKMKLLKNMRVGDDWAQMVVAHADDNLFMGKEMHV